VKEDEMSRKPLTTRTALIITTAMTIGSTAGTAADAIAAHFTYNTPGIGPIVTAITALWIFEKLDKIVDDGK
jgi:hypothetical protein